MAWLKVYEWERERWPEFRHIKITRTEAESYLRKFSRHFKTPVPNLVGGKWYGGGTYYHYKQEVKVKLSAIHLNTIIHEYAHHLNWMQFKQNGHRKSFKRCLKRVYSFAKRYLPKKKAEVLTPVAVSGTL
jgi:hypothetical protein